MCFRASIKMEEQQPHPDPNLIPRLQDAHPRNQSKAPASSEFNMVTATNLTPVIVAIVTVLVVAFLLVSYFRVLSTCYNTWILRRHPASDTSPGNHGLAATTTTTTHVSIIPTGLSGSVIRRIPVYRLSKSKKESLSSSDCSVCLGDFLEDEEVKILPKCKHAFHVDCIDIWLSSHSIFCPLCRCKVELNVEDSPDFLLDAQQQQAQDAQDAQDANVSGENVLQHGDTGTGESFHQRVILLGDIQPGDTQKSVQEKPSLKQQMSSGRKRNFLLLRVSSTSNFMQFQRHDDHADPTDHVADDEQASSSSTSPPRDGIAVEIDIEAAGSSDSAAAVTAATPNPNRGDNSVRRSTVWKMKRSLSSSRVFSFRKNRQHPSEDEDAHASSNSSQLV